ncbi:MAG: phosphate transporter, partial [Labilithrix sp.]|nr:phosphate transporter [Labilithrix sp.]
MSHEVAIVLVLVLGAELVNGWTDAPNAIATVIGTRALVPWKALVLATIFNTLGVLSGTAVATTIGTGIVDPSAISLPTVAAAMVGIIVWSSIAARWGIPTSESHALVAGLAGAGLASHGPSVLLWSGWQKVLLGLLFSSVLGLLAGGGAMFVISWALRRTSPQRTRGLFRWLQIGSSAFVAFGHGSNDGQKFMGAFTLALVLGGHLQTFAIPLWVVLLCAGVMALGTSIGGWRIIATLGTRLTKLDTHQGFAAELAAAGTISLA